MAAPAHDPAAPRVEIRDGVKTFTVLENNPVVMTTLAHRLGVSPSLAFHDVYSLDGAETASLPRPVHALLAIIPLTPAWAALRAAEDRAMPDVYPYPYPKDAAGTKATPDEPALWFQQTIGHACGSIGLLHCCATGSARAHVDPASVLGGIIRRAEGLRMAERAQMLYDDAGFEAAHQSVAAMGDTRAPDAAGGDRLGQHFVAFVVGAAPDEGDRRRALWELEGGRKGAMFRGYLDEGKDVLSEEALALGIGRIIAAEKEAGGEDLRYSITALCGE